MAEPIGFGAVPEEDPEEVIPHVVASPSRSPRLLHPVRVSLDLILLLWYALGPSCWGFCHIPGSIFKVGGPSPIPSPLPYLLDREVKRLREDTKTLYGFLLGLLMDVLALTGGIRARDWEADRSEVRLEELEARVDEAITEYKRNRANPEGARGAGVGNDGGGIAPEVRGCSYKTFLNCKPHSFNGTEGVVGLSCWFEKMESVFEISKFAKEDKVKYVLCTLKGRALTWWNRNVHSLGINAANQIPWNELKCNTPKMGRSGNDVPGALLHNTIAQVMRE
ncbi:hypothetical protein Tco_1377736 [Tanacetum coccineum]